VTLELRGSTDLNGNRITVDTDRMWRGDYSRTDGPLVTRWYDREMAERRYLAKCKGCGRGVSALVPCVVERRSEHLYGREVKRATYSTYVYTEAAGTENWTRVLSCSGCGKRVSVKPVAGKVNPDVGCDARCMNATGPNCECVCGGANHGASWG
jgi:hypothetical protein